MTHKIRELLTAPSFEDDEKNRIAGLVYLMGLVLLAGAVLAAIGALAVGYALAAQILAAGAGGLLISLWLTRRSRVAASSFLQLLAYLGVLVGLLVLGDGIHDIAAMAFPGVIVIAALLLRRRLYLLLVTLTIFALILVVLAELGGSLNTQFSQMTVPSDLVNVIAIMGITAVAAFFLAENIARSMAEVRESQAALMASNRELQREIAERQRAEEAYRALVDHSLQGLLILQEGRIVFVNRAFCQASGYTAEELLAMSAPEVVNLVHPDQREEVQALYNARWDEQSVQPHLQFRSIRKDGVVAWAEAYASLVEYRARPAIQMAIVDITDRRQNEDERAVLMGRIQAQASQLQQVVATVPDAVILLDVQEPGSGRILLANPPAVEFLTVLADPCASEILTRLGNIDLPTLFRPPASGWWHEVKGDAPSSREFQALARPLQDVPGATGWVLVLRDVTHERDVQARAQEQERLAAVGQLAAGIAHDFNNILATIVLYAQMSARSTDLPPKILERMETINQQAERGSALIQQILDFSRSAMLERRGMDLGAFLSEQVEILRRTLPSSIKVTLSHENGDMIIHADPTRIQQAVMNLAVNARDAMPHGGRLHFALSRRRIGPETDKTPPGMVPGDVVLLRVTDSGHGIPSDVLPHMFEPFFTTKPVGTGVGLGLAQVWGIIKQHEGHIRVETGAEEGTNFLIYLPATSTAGVAERHEDGDSVRSGCGQRILVVEDNHLVQKSLIEALDLLNYRSSAASNGREALALLQRELADPPSRPEDRIAVVLTDQVMPEMGGTELVKTLRTIGWDGPAILLTGHSMQLQEQDHSVALSLQKPVNLEQLSEALARVLGK